MLLCILLVLAAVNNQSEAQTSATEPVIPIGSEYENSIQLLNNRFRVDADVEEITMVFFREVGSAPIVLVKPDGSKLSLNQSSQDKTLKWYETETYDMISVTKPVAGPWQAVGQILPNSKVMVISEIGLEVEEIPSPVFSGEVLKQTAKLLNNGQQIDFSPFRDVVTLNIDFVSNNNPNYENFGLGSRRVATFKDDGTRFDERAADGIFTGQFNLDMPAGEWRPTFSVITPMYTREQINDLVLLQPTPIIINSKIDESEDGNHTFIVDVDRTAIDMSSLIFDGVIKFPSGEVKNTSFTYADDQIKTISVNNNEYGTYRLKITAFAKTIAGRDVVLDVPEHTFRTIAPPPPPPEPTPEELELALEAEKAAAEALIPEDTEMTATELAILVIGINALIIVVGGATIFIVMNIKNNPDNHVIIKAKLLCVSLLAKIKKGKKSADDTEASEKDASGKSKKPSKASKKAEAA